MLLVPPLFEVRIFYCQNQDVLDLRMHRTFYLSFS